MVGNKKLPVCCGLITRDPRSARQTGAAHGLS
jgi:hypothetical protein